MTIDVTLMIPHIHILDPQRTKVATLDEQLQWQVDRSKAILIDTQLDLQNHSTALFQAIEELASIPTPAGLWFRNWNHQNSLSEPFHEDLTDSALSGGGRIHYVRAGDLKPLSTHWECVEYPKNRAAFAYISMMPDDLPIFVHWH